jgi:hypothetical protein
MWIIFVDVDKGVDNFYLGVDMWICGNGCVGMWIREKICHFSTFGENFEKNCNIFTPFHI